jgi:hypothetical protein
LGVNAFHTVGNLAKRPLRQTHEKQKGHYPNADREHNDRTADFADPNIRKRKEKHLNVSP